MIGRALALIIAGGFGLGLAGCADSMPSLPKISELNPFSEKQQPLPGRRLPVLNAQEKVVGELASADTPVALPPPRVNEDWGQPGGDPNNSPGHLVLNTSVKQIWTADTGDGSSSKGRVTASPVVYQGRVYALDASGNVSAFAATGGSAIWRYSLVPEAEANAGSGFMSAFAMSSSAQGGYGGGIAAENGRLYAVSGFGKIAALDPASGKVIWEKTLGTPVRAAPTASGDRLFIISMDGRFYCLSGADGSEFWAVRGLPQQASLVMNVSPAVDGEIVSVPYPSGDLMTLKIADGSLLWTENLARTRGTSQLASLSDTATPAIDTGTVYAIGHAGRMVATSATTGERFWSLNIPGTQRPWVAGDSVFVVNTSGQLMAITRTDGSVRWTTKLPGAKTWSGPTLAGGQLWLASDKGLLVSVDAKTGKVNTQQSVGGPVFIAPVVAQGRMFILRDDAHLVALN
ncbi:Pyrrolo-quinoline quinone [Candidatus Filomicrobium marinum]|uniref:Pyrrolo-quinoline quinone n=2 Tax=Filomicrobium TaxID=119044 RepID=A0A0D6JAJ7_9HYPH|nr:MULTISPECIES: PQQ-binding-like beta-propeller repeat protein [Filomicrobium]MCV0368863.1 PQQ-binding-like beta-propeller repeat protein [Filomicrobium sp.]CFW97621.1 Pyrrolo-quinoline quinone [Candidatus Filomicrobium marinum]CPR14722.1 Pyrrolo-quinoline quinone [Candidatus Filomicrobium marinum]SDO76566.1 Outer membrane protein assembly factor BamB, contains PQQ-like beta-propeller repeat [Filomicrobium insigne]